MYGCLEWMLQILSCRCGRHYSQGAILAVPDLGHRGALRVLHATSQGVGVCLRAMACESLVTYFFWSSSHSALLSGNERALSNWDTNCPDKDVSCGSGSCAGVLMESCEVYRTGHLCTVEQRAYR